MLQLQEARAAFECGIMRLAAENLDPGDIAALEEVVEGMHRAAEEGDYETFLALHKRFHLGIAKATKNVVVEQDGRRVLLPHGEIPFWRQLEECLYLLQSKGYFRESVALHERILLTPIPAHQWMEGHFQRCK